MQAKSDISKRIRDARYSLGWVQRDLAERLGKTPANISQYESGDRTPDIKDVEEIAQTLRRPIEYFVGTKVKNAKLTSPIFFRALKAVRSAKHCNKFRVIIEEAVELHQWISDYVTYPQLNLVEVTNSDLSDPEIEDLAEKLRAAWGIGNGPIENFIALVEKNGIIISKIPFGSDMSTDAFSAFIDDVPYIFLNSEVEACSRQRFNLAHELAHILLHRNICVEELKKPGVLKRIEDQANFFAGAFTMPADRFGGDVFASFSLSDFLRLKAVWKVSVAAMIMRSLQLEHISQDRATYLFRQINYKGWRKCEPGESHSTLDDSSVGRSAFKLLIAHDHSVLNRLLADQITDSRTVFRTLNINPDEISGAEHFTPKIISHDFGRTN